MTVVFFEFPSKLQQTFNHYANEPTTVIRVDDFLVCRITGEYYGKYDVREFVPPTCPVKESLPRKRPLARTQMQDARMLQLRLTEAANDSQNAAQETAASNVVALPVKRITKPKKFTTNPIAKHILLADVREELAVVGIPKQKWVEDYVMGACYTVAKASKGKLNVSPAHVYTAVKMEAVSTGHIMAMCEGISERQAQRIAQCARYALTGMQMYLDQNQSLYDALQLEIDAIDGAYDDYQQAA